MEDCPGFDSKNNPASQAASLHYVTGPAVAYSETMWDNGRVCVNRCKIIFWNSKRQKFRSLETAMETNGK